MARIKNLQMSKLSLNELNDIEDILQETGKLKGHKKKHKHKYTKKQQQLKRVRQFISRAEKRGYRFDSEFKEQLSALSTQKLKNLTPKKLYEKAQAISQETGKVVIGTVRKKEERKEAAQKAQETRRRHKAEKEQREYYKDAERKYSEYEASYEDGILRGVEARIAQYEVAEVESYRNGAQMLKEALTEEIASYGRIAVALSCENSPSEAKEYTDQVIFWSTDEKKRQALQVFLLIIRTGVINSIEEAKQIGETMDTYEDFENPL